MFWVWGILSALLVVFINQPVSCNQNAKILYKNLMSRYNKLIRPVSNSSERLTVKLGLRLSQLIGVDEKNQVMTTNVWLSQEWFDYYLQWNPADYGGVDSLYIPASDIWTPDIVLYNNAEGSFQVTMATKATVRFDGAVLWEPPAIYKSSCAINVEHFPFDEQVCFMKFSSWTYDYGQLDLKHMSQADLPGEVDIQYAIDMSEYYPSFIWDIMDIPARRNEVKYLCCPEIFPDVTFYITIRRKTLFYTVNLIIPCVSISFLTVLVFYLPSDSGEKITLCISILLSLTVFFLLLSELIPPTSLVVPLIGKYLVFTMMLVTFSIIITVISLNLHSRSVTTHVMPYWLRVLFIEKLPKVLMMRRPDCSRFDRKFSKKVKSRHPSTRRSSKASKQFSLTGLSNKSNKAKIQNGIELESLLPTMKDYLRAKVEKARLPRSPHLPEGFNQTSGQVQQSLSLPPVAEKALDELCFIAEHLENEEFERKVKEDWKYIALVFDRLFMWVFTAVCSLGSLAIILQAPTLYDNRKPYDHTQH